ncbi:MAG: hypothetical protein MK128_05550 [Dehalococcoidia bacterium]|nr:hypothetical protein [Dehalococcoidia bacterium]
MAEDEASKQGMLDFDGAGEARPHVSLERAKLLAMQTARDNRADYGRGFAKVRMNFQAVEHDEGEDYFFVTLSFRPEGDFRGTPGQERFVIEKEGAIAGRQVLSLPSGGVKRRFLWRPLAIVAALVVLAAVGGAFAAGFFGEDVVGPVQEPVTGAPTASGKLTLFLVPSAGNPRSLSPSAAGLGKVSLANVPLVFRVPRSDYQDLREYLLTESSLIFSGSGFSGVWADEKARLVMQLNGPLKNANYLRCVGLGINGEVETSSCGTSFTSYEFVTGGYKVVVELPAPPRLEKTDRLELSIVLATPLQQGEKAVPTLVYGGDIPLKTSFLEIGND